MSLAVLATAFGIIFLAELGDKTQLTAVALAARYPWKKVFVGLAAAFAILNALAVVVGGALFALVPRGWIELAAAALFLFFGVKTLISGDDDDDDDAGAEKQEGKRGPVVTSFLLIFLAELGDKTQIATAGLAANTAAPFSVFVGATLALWCVSLLGLLVGAQVARVVPMKWVHRAAGVAFLAFGLWTGWQAAKTFGLV